MASRSLTMTKSNVSSFIRRIFFLLGKFGLLVFLTMAAGWGYGYALLKTNLFSRDVQTIMVMLMSAVVAGILARFILHPEGKFAAFFAALIAMAVSQIDLAGLSGGLIGSQLPAFSPAGIIWGGTWFLIPGIIVILLALFAWRQKPSRTIPVKKTSTEISSNRPAKKTVSRTKSSRTISKFAKTLSIKKITKPVQAFIKKNRKQAMALLSKFKTQSRVVVRKTAGAFTRRRSALSAHLPAVKFHRARMAVQTGALSTAVPATRRMPKSAHSPIRLVGREEHRCPYCLCVVSPGDPNGIVVCPVCKTYHHKNCWDVTGECQVPHIHE